MCAEYKAAIAKKTLLSLILKDYAINSARVQGTRSTKMSVHFVRGLPFTEVTWFQPKSLKETMDYVPHDGDIILASYPKTGITWLQYIVYQIINKGESYPSFDDITYKIIPFMELTGVSAIEALKGTRIYKHHYAYNLVQKNDKAKYLYIYRNPEDTLISYYHFLQNVSNITIDLNQFFENFLNGNIGCGYTDRYFEHVASFFAHKEDKNLLLISYEKLHANRKEEILRIAKFLGEEYFLMFSQNESLLEKIIERTNFDYMKKNLSLTHLESDKAESFAKASKCGKFLRKGIVGDGKNCLSSEQLKRVRELAASILKGTGVTDEWGN